MSELIIIFLLVILLVLLVFIYDVDIRKIKKIAKNDELNKITNELPENVDICKQMQKMLNNEVNIEEDMTTKTSLYLIMTNKILIANIKDSYTRIQTIAHECIHSIQPKKVLCFNFIYSNIYIIYYFAIIVLTIIGFIKNSMLQINILLVLSFIYYSVRSYLEIDAMTRAPYLALEYIKKSQKLKDEQVEKINVAYKELNKNGIVVANFSLLANTIFKIILYIIIVLVLNLI